MTIASEILTLISSMLEPTPLAIIVSVILVVTLPVLLHFLLHSSSLSSNTSHNLPTILLLGPSSSGKTSLLTLFETGTAKPTLTSQTPLTVKCSLPTHSAAAGAAAPSAAAADTQYRAEADPANQAHYHHHNNNNNNNKTSFLLADTPGHAKLRHHALAAIRARYERNIKGFIFTVDAANLAPGSDDLRQTAEYLHDILLLLQKQEEKSSPSSSLSSSSSSAAKKPGVRVLIAANKADLFTALPAVLVRRTLEKEIALVRESLKQGLLGSGVDEATAEEKGWLGEVGEEKGEFRFEQLEEAAGVVVTVKGGSVLAEKEGGKGDVQEWWEWVGECVL